MEHLSQEDQDNRDCLMYEQFGGLIETAYVAPLLIMVIGYWDDMTDTALSIVRAEQCTN